MTQIYHKNNLLKYIAAILFILPIIFFTCVYFLQVVSSEDIYQGAGKPANLINDAIAAFHWSARLGDMYAWSVINFFDYTYSFGVDTIFRLIDTLLAVGIFYMMTVIVIGRKPKLSIQDGIIFTTLFLAVFLSEYSRSLVSSFSHIHNYLFITFFSLLFATPFIQKLRKGKISYVFNNKIAMTIIGFLFGFSSNVTPIVFLATLVVYIVCHDNFAKDQKIIKTRFWESSLFFAIIGIFIAIVLMYGFGPGVGSYTTGYNSSYVSISSLLQTPAIGFTNLISNLVHNFKDVAAIVIIMYLSLLVELIISKKRLMKNSNISSFGVKFSAICLVFFVIHVLIVSQINTTGMTRILIPAYIATIVSIVLTISRMIEILSISRRMIFYIASLLIIITSVITIDIGIVMFKHSAQAKTVLERIRLEPGSRVCVTPADNPSAKSPLLKYYQREIFTDWTMPATVYDKQVDWCV